MPFSEIQPDRGEQSTDGQAERRTVERASVVMLLSEEATQQEYVLLIKRNNKGSQAGKWEFPGGKPEGKRSLPRTVLFEVPEETGVFLDPDKLQYLPDYASGKVLRHTEREDSERQRYLNSTQFYYKETVESLPFIDLSDEHTDYLWLNTRATDYERKKGEASPLQVQIQQDKMGAKKAIGWNPLHELELTDSASEVLEYLLDDDGDFLFSARTFVKWEEN